jgi:non-haem Fe2+, alpha-ketoglutarate-dependent halogenase
MPKLLSSSAIEAYRRDGFYFPVPALSTREVARYRECLEKHEAQTGAPLQGNWRHKAHLLFTWVDEIVRHPTILDAAEDILGPDLFCWTTNFFIKEARSPGFVSWHQDAFYWGLSRDDVMTAWVALSPANLESGCMKFLPGSHNQDHLQHIDTFHKDNLLSRGQEIAVDVDAEASVDCILEPGEISLHHVKLVHGSEPNRSADRRIGLAIRYQATQGSRFRHLGSRRRPLPELRSRAAPHARPERGCACSPRRCHRAAGEGAILRHGQGGIPRLRGDGAIFWDGTTQDGVDEKLANASYLSPPSWPLRGGAARHRLCAGGERGLRRLTVAENIYLPIWTREPSAQRPSARPLPIACSPTSSAIARAAAAVVGG